MSDRRRDCLFCGEPLTLGGGAVLAHLRLCPKAPADAAERYAGLQDRAFDLMATVLSDDWDPRGNALHRAIAEELRHALTEPEG